jgi:hypothetical protein
MKGQAAIPVDTLGIIVIAGAMLTLFFITLPQIIDQLWKETNKISADVVSKELAGYITISAAAPHSIEITYNPSETTYYNVEINNRLVTVTIAKSGEIYEKTKGINSIAVDVPRTIVNKVNSFNIIKYNTGVIEVRAS